MTDTENELKPCPFCGGEAAFGRTEYGESHEAWWSDGTQVLTAHFLSCVRCGGNRRSIVGGQQTQAEAIAAWNQRAPQAGDAHKPAPDNAALVAELDLFREFAAAFYPLGVCDYFNDQLVEVRGEDDCAGGSEDERKWERLRTAYNNIDWESLAALKESGIK